MKDVLTGKIQSIHRCVKRAKEEYENLKDNFRNDFSRQDAAILNVIRACEQAIDFASYLIRTRKLGIPNDSSEAFSLLESGRIISPELSEKLQNIVSFRNTVIQEYQKINIDIVVSVIQKDLNNLVRFTDAVVKDVRGTAT